MNADAASPGDDVVYVGSPRGGTLPVERRWGYVTNSRRSRSQFVLYRAQDGLHLALEAESGKDATIPSPDGIDVMDSVSDAYEMVLKWFSSMLVDSWAMGGRFRRVTIVDTTDESNCFEMGNLWVEDGDVYERRCLDPETLRRLG
jgi:hypothetical protein